MQTKKVQDITADERKLLSHLKKHPGVFLGEVSLQNFWHMTGGYDMAMWTVGEQESHRILPEGLNEFTAAYYGVLVGSQSCFSLILQREPDDGTALAVFFEILNRYLKSLGYEPIP